MKNEKEPKTPTSSPTPMPASVTTTVLEAADEGEDADATRDTLRVRLELEGDEYRIDEATNAYDALTHLRTARQSHSVVLD